MTIAGERRLPHIDRSFARAFAALVSALATLFVLSQIYRNTNALIAPELAVELGLSPAALGGIQGAFDQVLHGTFRCSR